MVSFRSRRSLFCQDKKEHSDSKSKCTEDDIINMVEFLVENIFVVFGGKVFQQIVGIPMNANCAPLLAKIFLYSYEGEFIQHLLYAVKKQLASQLNFTYRYIDDVLSINYQDFEKYLGQMYPAQLEIKDMTESNTSASYLIYSCRTVSQEPQCVRFRRVLTCSPIV